MLYFLTCFAGWNLGLSRPEQKMQTDMENVSFLSAALRIWIRVSKKGRMRIHVVETFSTLNFPERTPDSQNMVKSCSGC